MKSKLLILIFLLAGFSFVHAQENRQRQLESIRKELNEFLEEKKNTKHSTVIEEKIQQQLNIHEPGHELSVVERQERYLALHRFYWENEFWKSHRQYETFISQRGVGNGINLCNNGSFENGNTAFTFFGGIFNNNSNNCQAANAIPFNPTIPTDPTGNVPGRMEVVGLAADPVVPGLMTAQFGNNALRINSNINLAGGNCSNFGAQVDRATTTFTVDAQTTILTFSYAVVMENPNHTGSNGQNPFFTARVRDNVTNVVQQICFDPSQNNMLQSPASCSSPVLWVPWRCQTFNLTQSIGHEVTLEFIVADCGQTGHYGYAYIDGICIGCNNNGNTGAVSIASNDSCFTDGVNFNGTFTLPAIQGSTLQNISVQVRQNNTLLATLTPAVAGNTFTGMVPANLLTAGNGYDLVAVVTFNVPGVGIVTASGEIVNGLNNDFIATDRGCCDATDTPAFTIQTSCRDGVLTVTATSTDPDPANHWWGLMETSMPGVVTDAATLNGGNPVAPVQNGAVATFTITDFSRFYYIKHGIWDDCYTWREQRTPVVLPQLSNVFTIENAAGVIKSEFCYGEDIYLDGTASSGENQYFIDVRRRPIGNTGPFIWYEELGWTGGQVTIVNLSQQFANLNPPVYFEPGYEYEVKLALSNIRNCVAWTERTRRFKVICCRDYISAEFSFNAQNAPNNYSITAHSFNTYSNVNAVHEWYVLSSPNPGGGPYTPVASTTSTLATSVLLYNNAQAGLYYILIHKVKTLCGEVCISHTQYANRNGNIDIEAAQEDCCLAFQYWPNGPGATMPYSAAFKLGSVPIGGGQYTINTYPQYNYTNNSSITHEWYVLSSPNPSGGPYTSVAQGTGYNFSYSPANSGLYYFIIHRLKSPCGDVCYGQSICHNCRGTEAECELCGPIDCRLLDEIWISPCDAPRSLRNDCIGKRLTWSAVTGAISYTVEVSFNDPLCCRSRYDQSTHFYNVSGTVLNLSTILTPVFDCLRWRVLTRCERGQSVWSDWMCFDCTTIATGPVPISRLSEQADGQSAFVQNGRIAEPSISPNPNKGEMNLSLKVKERLILSVEVFNSQGSLVKTIRENVYPDGNFNATLQLGTAVAKGPYLVVFKTNQGNYRKWVIIN